MLRTIDQTADRRDLVEICVYIDSDDEESKVFLEGQSNVKFTTSPTPLNLSQMWNYAYEKLATGDIIMLCADDLRFNTKSWDTIVRNKYQQSEDKLILVYGRDGIHDSNLSTHPFVHRRWIEISGFWLPPYFVSDYNDLWLFEVGKQLNRLQFCPDVYTEHLHHSVGKCSIDDTTQRRLDRHNTERPDILYNNTLHERQEQVRRLRSNMHSNRNILGIHL